MIRASGTENCSESETDISMEEYYFGCTDDDSTSIKHEIHDRDMRFLIRWSQWSRSFSRERKTMILPQRTGGVAGTFHFDHISLAERGYLGVD